MFSNLVLALAMAAPLATNKDSVSYAFGMFFAKSAHSQLTARDSINFNLDTYLEAFRIHFRQDTAHYLMKEDAIYKALRNLQHVAQEEKQKLPETIITQGTTASYALGAYLGKQVHDQVVARDSINLNIDVFCQAFKIRFKENSAKYLLNDEEAHAILLDASKRKDAERRRANDDFLVKNKKAKGVTTTKSGLQYKVIAKGKGATPSSTDIVKVHYTGTLINGKKFDSSFDRGEPLEFKVDAVIPGWTEMLELMKVGEKVIAWIPPHLAYGEDGRPPKIPGHSVLVFEMELLDAHAP